MNREEELIAIHKIKIDIIDYIGIYKKVELIILVVSSAPPLFGITFLSHVKWRSQ